MKNKLVPVFDLAKGLNYIADKGFWPQVVYDDNGNWAIFDEGGANIRLDDDQDYAISGIVPAESFKRSIEEAWQEYMRKLESLGNELDYNCAYAPPYTTINELVEALEGLLDAIENGIWCYEDADGNGDGNYIGNAVRQDSDEVRNAEALLNKLKERK